MTQYTFKVLSEPREGHGQPIAYFSVVTVAIRRFHVGSQQRLAKKRIALAKELGITKYAPSGDLKRIMHLAGTSKTLDGWIAHWKKEGTEYTDFSKADREEFDALTPEEIEGGLMFISRQRAFTDLHMAEVCAMATRSIDGSPSLINPDWKELEWPALTYQGHKEALQKRTAQLEWYVDTNNLIQYFKAADVHIQNGGLKQEDAKKSPTPS